MFFERIFFCFSLLHLVNPHLQINLHLTDWVSEDDNLQHDCLQVPIHTNEESDPRQIISYCMGEWPSKFPIKENNYEQKFMFEQLFKKNIKSEELYLWSAPIDLIEEYQFYLNQLSKSEKTTLATRIFYNCTLPYFGPQCQYVLQDQKPFHPSLDGIIHDYYYYNAYQPTLLTCYMHLECNRGPSPSCLDWTEICDGKVDCHDGGFDEEYCWQLELHQYNEDEYQYSNGQCIPEAFYRYDISIPDCLYHSRKIFERNVQDPTKSAWMEPSSIYEDIGCADRRNDFRFGHMVSSCVTERDNLLLNAMFSIKPHWLSNECWTAMKCVMYMPNQFNGVCQEFCFNDNRCTQLIRMTCPDIIIVPAVPLLFGHVHLAYEKNKPIYRTFSPAWPQYPCYNYHLLHLPIKNESLLFFNDTACGSPPDLLYPTLVSNGRGWNTFIKTTFLSLNRFQSTVSSDLGICNRSNMYQCINSSKCITKNRLYDKVIDCLHRDDEENLIGEHIRETILLVKNCSTIPNPTYFKCKSTNECIRGNLVDDGSCHCTPYEYGRCDDEYPEESYARNTISFQTICDGFSHLSSTFTENENETDETNCEQWPLVHIYNRCDGFWHTSNGSDEINCNSSPLLNCSIDHHICVSSKTVELMCLSMDKVNDGTIDCLGAADEVVLSRSNSSGEIFHSFYCKWMNTDYHPESLDICDKHQLCDNDEDERACTSSDLSEVSQRMGICTRNYKSDGSEVAKVLCRYFTQSNRRWRKYFTLDQSETLNKNHRNQEDNLLHPSVKQSVQWYQPRCHRGLDLQLWLDKAKKSTINVCLCPPSYYGDICQYQNQRVSLILKFRASSDSVHIPFNIIVSLIDHSDERLIHSYEQFTYLPMKNCQKKFYITLLYSTRPKTTMKDYSIQIDMYEKKTLNYRGSIIKSLNFSFLPVHRLVYSIDIPRISDSTDDCSDSQCFNGKCRKYFNDRTNRTFCQCHKGWSGGSCTIEYTSTCSSDSLSLGQLANNRSLCVCPVNKMGPRCLVNDATCYNTPCMNKGECISVDEYETSMKRSICLCPKEFTRDRCEISRTKLMITFDKNTSLPSYVLVHFIEAQLDAPHVRTTTFKTVSPGQTSMTVYWSLPFHLAFVELSNQTYYFIHMQKISRQSSVIEKTLNSTDRCLNISELFNETIAKSSLLHRIKYYHLPCQTNNSSNLKCFYDDIHLCLCQQLDQQRVANCFEFDHHMNLYCSGSNDCENGGQCYQEYTTCPRISICQCPLCYYGSRCQLSTSGFSLSLDAILGYHIRPNQKISQQPWAVLISLILTVLITLLGLTNGILSFITFKHESTRESGCGLYLFISSIVTLLTMILFSSKFLILLFSQMGSITNRLFLTIQCYSIDFLLRSSLTIDQWLMAFVATERAFVIMKGIHFNKAKSKSAAKWIIISLILITIVTNIHDPIYRSLFEENDHDDENRIWCTVNYPSAAIRTTNIVINILHFVVPFIVNIISAVIIILRSSRQQATVHKKTQYREILKVQFQQHRNLLIGPCVLIILGIPRLIISFASGCMKTTSDSWLFLLGYFVSLIPPLLTFVLFVLPSTVYKETFRKAMSQYEHLFNRRS